MITKRIDIILSIGILAMLLFGFTQLHKYLTKGGTLVEFIAMLSVFAMALLLLVALINKKRQNRQK